VYFLAILISDLVCRYIYDHETGSPETTVNSGSTFKDIDEDSVCPACGASKDFFDDLD
jgi:rubredoxin